MAKIARLVAVDVEETTGDFWVKVIDYDGTVLLEKRGNNGDSFDLPSAPSHEGLVFQEWSASQAITDNKIIIADNNVMVGAVYTTASGQNEFDITLTKVTGLSVTLNMDGTKDWGDGTSDTNTTHTYVAYGDYTIKCNGTTITAYGLFGGEGGAKNYYCTEARFATIRCINDYAFQNCYSLINVVISNNLESINTYAFYSSHSLISIVIPNSVTNIYDSAFCDCYSLKNIVIPNNVRRINSYTFQNCYSLTSIIIPNSVTNINENAFQYCYSLTSVVISNNVTSIGEYAFYYCYSLTSVIIPNSVTRINSYAFQNCYSLTKYDFSQCTAVLKLSNTNAFSGINGICKIIVPDSLYDEWIAAANWSTYADYIYKASEVTA